MRKEKFEALVLSSVLAFILSCVCVNAAPQNAQHEQGEHAAKQEAAADFNNYRVKYTVDEVENGKTTNSRSYTLIVKAGTPASVRIDARVVYHTENAGKNTLVGDVGMDIDCNIRKQEGNLVVHTNVSMQTTHPGSGERALPESNVVSTNGQFRLQSSTVATLGKPVLVGSADDIATNRQYVVKVTVSKAK